jgi:pyocin large subunit-like protein
MSARTMMIAGAGCALLLGLTACNRNQASAGRHDQSAASGAAGSADTYASADRSSDRRGSGGYRSSSYSRDEQRDAAPLFHGEPMWSENRNHTAQENAEYQFHRSGPDLGVKTLDAFLTKVHAFGDHPPAGTLHIERSNGDKLLYDPKANMFAVFTRDGAPRTIFKPRDGMEYWNEQKSREVANSEGGGRSGRRYGGQYSDRPTSSDDRADRGQ